MQMSAEAIEKIEEMAQEAHAKPDVKVIDGKHYVVGADDITPLAREPKPYRATLNDIDSLILACRDDSEVFVRAGTVEAVVDPEDRNDRLFVQLNHTETYQNILDFDKKPLSVKEAVNFLVYKIDYGGYPLTKALRKVEFDRKTTVKANVNTRREDYDSSVEAVIRTESDIDEEFSYSTNMYSNEGFECPVTLRVGVDIDFDNQRIRFVIMPNEIENAYSTAERTMQESLMAKEGFTCKVFRGKPA